MYVCMYVAVHIILCVGYHVYILLIKDDTTDLELQPNPAYGTSHKVTMDTNPAYESCK